MKIIWSKSAVNQFYNFLEWVAEDSILQAERIENEIVQEIEKLPKHPKRYPSDKFKLNNTGDYRAFELFNVRISYKISINQILILRIRHVKQKPKKY